MTKTKKWYEVLGIGIFAAIGLVFAFALGSFLYSWYLLGFAYDETVLTSIGIVILLIYAFLFIAYWVGKKYGLAYEKAILLAIGFTIGLIIIAFIFYYLNWTASTSVSIGAFLSL